MSTIAAQAEPALRAAIYDRVSKDPTHQAKSVQDQEVANRQAVQDEGWTLAGVYVDNDRSASRFATKARDDWSRLLRDLEARQFDVLVLWEPSRGSREMSEWIGLLETCRRQRVLIFVTSDDRAYDPLIARDWKTLATAGVDSAHESDKTSERLLKRFRNQAREGTSHGFTAWGWRRIYSFDDRGRPTGFTEVLVDEEAAIIREVTGRVLGGESLRAITADLNRRGLKSPRGKDWQQTTLRQVVLRPRNAGLAVHKGAVVAEGKWPAILDRDTFDRLLAKMTSPDRRSGGNIGPRSKYLLSGIARCGRDGCDGLMRVLVPTPSRSQAHAYACVTCHRVRRDMAKVDDLVTRVIVKRLARPDAIRALTAASGNDAERDALVAHRDALRAKLDLAADQLADDVIDAQQLARISSKLRPQLVQVEADLKQHSSAPDLLDLARPDIAAVWDDVPLERKRAVIAALLTVRVLPLGSGKRWDPRSVEITEARGHE